MAFFKPKSLPATSYGYLPPTGATAHGWKCTNYDCGTSDHEPVRRWPKPCAQCGSATDPLFDQPWEHDADGVELEWLLKNHPDRGGGFHKTRWHIWRFKDALLRGDQGGAAEARVDARAYAAKRLKEDSWFGLGDVYFLLVWHDLEASNLDWAADDLMSWFGLSSTDDVENNNTNRTNSRQIIDMTAGFRDAGGSSHARMADIRSACLGIAEAAFQILNREQQDVVNQLSRS